MANQPFNTIPTYSQPLLDLGEGSTSAALFDLSTSTSRRPTTPPSRRPIIHCPRGYKF